MRRRDFIKRLAAVPFGMAVCANALPARQGWPLNHFHCPRCFGSVKEEEWHIPPYKIAHGTCPEHGPQWGFEMDVPVEVRVEFLSKGAPPYRICVDMSGPIYRRWISTVPKRGSIHGHILA